jgi:hypothetical protein
MSNQSQPPATNFSPPPAEMRPKDPNFILGVVGFALSFIGVLNIAGLIISIIAFTKSKRLGINNGFALAGIIIAGIGVLFVAIVLLLIVPTLVDAAQTCARLGDGVHRIAGATYTCTPTSFHVSRGF